MLSTKGAVVVAKAQQCEKGMWMQSVQKFPNSFHLHLRPDSHQESGPMFNPDQAFLLVQKLKSAPKVLH